MKVLYDLQAFKWTKYSGIPRYFLELIRQYNIDKSLDVQLPCSYCLNNDYKSLYSDKSSSISWRTKDFIITRCPQSFKIGSMWALSARLNPSIKLIENGDYDLFHPTFFKPYFLKHIGNKPYVMTIHDMTYEKYPEYFPLNTNVREFTRKAISGASRFIADSIFTKNEFIQYYDIDSNMVDVVYLASPFERYTLNHNRYEDNRERYILFVGERGRHKNFYQFAESISQILRDSKSLYLLCAGGGTFKSDEIDYFNSLGIKNKVIQESINNERLVELYQNAVAFVYPSINEGFGLPILEAFKCGCPVICTNASSFPEIAGDAAVYFEPKDAESMHRAIQKVINDDKLRCNMRDKGYEQMKKFSWKRCADETKSVYNKVLD